MQTIVRKFSYGYLDYTSANVEALNVAEVCIDTHSRVKDAERKEPLPIHTRSLLTFQGAVPSSHTAYIVEVRQLPVPLLRNLVVCARIYDPLRLRRQRSYRLC